VPDGARHDARAVTSHAGRLKVASRRPRSARRRDAGGPSAWRASAASAILDAVMYVDASIIWIVLAVALAAAELVWPSFFLAPFAAGAALGAVSQWAGLGTVAALVGFVASSGLLLTFVRPIARRHLYTPQAARTGVAALIGRTAIVAQRVDNDAQTGLVKLEGELWTARCWDEDEVLAAGKRVHVVEIKGATALVSEN
jgi:membrane protein implicated in regulation of membrane protease activity